jgi:hypothetical protein
LPFCGNRRHVDDLGVGQLAFDVFDAPLDKALLLARGVILGVFLEIAVGAGLGDRLDDAGRSTRFSCSSSERNCSAPLAVRGTLFMG